MILTRAKIEQEVQLGKIEIEPFDPANLGPNSYDVTINKELLIYTVNNYSEFLDTKRDNKTDLLSIPESGHIFYPKTLYLARTNERTFTKDFVPMLEGKSSLGRLGINIHATAGFGDLGFNGFWTLEISVIHPVKIYPNMKIGQLYFMETSGDKTIQYKGKYQNNCGVQSSKSWMDS